MRLVVVGDIHTQDKKMWQILSEAGLSTEENKPTELMLSGTIKLVLLGDLFHAKSRKRYSEIVDGEHYDEYNPDHVRRSEDYHEELLTSLKAFYDAVPAGDMVILMGNHDFNAVSYDQGPLRTDDIAHFEWKQGNELDPELREWVESWPYEYVYEGVHFAHVGPFVEHNTYDDAFYLQNRRRWIYEDKDFFEDSDHKFGVYGHTPVRGGVNLASRGRAILLDTNGHGEEYAFLEIEVEQDDYRLRMRGLFFDELMPKF